MIVSTKMKDEYKLALALLTAQVMMVTTVVAVVASPWYSIYFYQMLKEQALENYRATAGKRVVALSTGELDRYSHAKGVDATAIDMYVDEEIATRRILEKPEQAKPFLDKFNSIVDSDSDQSQTALDMRQIALQKLIRLKILTSESYLRNRKPVQAEALAKSALEDLKQQQRNLDTAPQQTNVARLLDLLARAKDAQGDSLGKSQVEATKISLTDPTLARDWYHRNNLKGFEESYPAEYVVRHIMSSNKINKKEALEEALKKCATPSVRTSTKVYLLQEVMKEAFQSNNTELEDLALKFWLTHCSQTPIRFRPEASLVHSLKGAMHRSGSEQVFKVMTAKLEESLKLDLLSRAQAQDYINEYELRGLILKRWPPKSKREARTRERELAHLSELARSKGLYTFHVDVARAFTLALIDHVESAEQLLLKAFHELHSIKTFHPDQPSLVTETLGVAQTVAGKHSTAAYERAWKIVHTAVNCFDDWNPASKVSLLENLYHYCNRAHEKEKIACLNEIIQITNSNKLDLTTMRGVTFFIVNNCIETGKMNEASTRFNKAKKEFGEDSREFCDLCCDLIMYRRAYPAYAPVALKVCNEEPFPNNAFQMAPRVAERSYGKDSLRYLASLQYLAQYELCRGNNDRALELCDQFMRSPQAKKSTLYVANLDLTSELRHKTGLSVEHITTVPGSIIELTCLANVYNHVRNTRARDRLTAFKSRVIEE